MRRNDRAASYLLVGVGVLLVAVGTLFSGLMWRSFQRARAMTDWPVVEARILKSEVGERRIGPDEPAEFRFEVLYGYEWHGARLTSDRWSLRGSPWSSRPDAARERVAEFPTGSRVGARVNPADPTQAVLRIDSRAPGYSLWFPALFVVGGAGIVWGALRRWRATGPTGRSTTKRSP